MTDSFDADYGETFASVYDALYSDRDDVSEVATLVSELAGGGSVLELGVGTGRLAIPIAQRGMPVVGVDNSEAMLRQLREKPGGDLVDARLADMSDFDLAREFDVILVAFSTVFLLPSQEAQVALFSTAARHLTPNGSLLVECFVHDPYRWRNNQEVTALAVETDRVVLRLALHDPATQTITAQQVTLSDAGAFFRPVRLRYASLAELDLMARLAHLRLAERWSGWSRAPFASSDSAHVSRYVKARAT